MEKEKFRLRHPEIWIIALIISIATAVVAFAFSCSNMNKQDPGLYEITPNKIAEVDYYASDFSFYYYFDGKEDIRTKKDEITTFYSDNLSYLYATYDEETIYNSYVSIARLNEHPNEEVEIPDTLYNILFDAYKKTNFSSNYSIFASPLYAFWNRQMSFNKIEREKNDPINNPDSVTYLANVASYVNNRNHVDLVLNEKKAMIKVSDEYISFRKDQGIEAPLISLNILKNAYILQGISSLLNEKGYNAGFIVSSDGNVVELVNSTLETYSYYSVKNLTLKRAGDISLINNPSSGSVYRRFNLNASEFPNYYYFTKDGVTYFRSLYIDISNGLENNLLLSSGIYDNDIDILEKAYLNNEIVKLNSLQEIRDYISSNKLTDKKIALNMVNEPETIYISNSLKEMFKLNTELDYNLNNI